MNSSALWWWVPFVPMAHWKEPGEAWRTPPFCGPLLTYRLLKTPLLLPLTSAQRVSDLCALWVRPSCLLMREDVTDAALKIRPLHSTILKLCSAQGRFRQRPTAPLMRTGEMLRCFLPFTEFGLFIRKAYVATVRYTAVVYMLRR